MYQMHKNYINQEINEIINLIARLIVIKPTEEQKSNSELKEIVADFVTAQVRSLSFVVYFKNNKVTGSWSNLIKILSIFSRS